MEREAVQKRTFTRWMNLHLQKVCSDLSVTFRLWGRWSCSAAWDWLMKLHFYRKLSGAGACLSDEASVAHRVLCLLHRTGDGFIGDLVMKMPVRCRPGGEAASFVCLLLKNICRNRITDRMMELFSLNRPEDDVACLSQTRRWKCVCIFHKDQQTMQQLLITPCDGVLQSSGFIFKTEHPFSRPYDEAASSPSNCHNVTDSTGCLFFWNHPENQPSLRPPNGNQYGALTGTLVAALVLLWQRSSCQCLCCQNFGSALKPLIVQISQTKTLSVMQLWMKEEEYSEFRLGVFLEDLVSDLQWLQRLGLIEQSWIDNPPPPPFVFVLCQTKSLFSSFTPSGLVSNLWPSN